VTRKGNKHGWSSGDVNIYLPAGAKCISLAVRKPPYIQISKGEQKISSSIDLNRFFQKYNIMKCQKQYPDVTPHFFVVLFSINIWYF